MMLNANPLEIYQKIKTAANHATANASQHFTPWEIGVRSYAIDLLDCLEEDCQYLGQLPVTAHDLHSLLLNGAEDWRQYSMDGNALYFNDTIALRLGAWKQYENETPEKPLPPLCWLELQAVALAQAERLIMENW